MADTEIERRQGLSGRQFLPENEGMLFVFDQPGRYGFWMKEMNFPLDFIWISGNRVVEITAEVPVTRMDIRPQQPISWVVEVNSGFAASHGIKINDKVNYEPVSD